MRPESELGKRRGRSCGKTNKPGYDPTPRPAASARSAAADPGFGVNPELFQACRRSANCLHRAYGAPASISPRIGPGFDCAEARQPLSLMICAGPGLSRADLIFNQAYWALLQQVGSTGQGKLKTGQGKLKKEDRAFLDWVQQLRGIPHFGPLPVDGLSSHDCVKNAFEAQQSTWLARLSGPALEEAQRPIERHLTLAQRPQRLGYVSPTVVIHGVYSPPCGLPSPRGNAITTASQQGFSGKATPAHWGRK
jgi:uncharacterized protein YecT (DUF1311 family)